MLTFPSSQAEDTADRPNVPRDDNKNFQAGHKSGLETRSVDCAAYVSRSSCLEDADGSPSTL